MPILSDIEFDGPNMALGIRDRFGDQQLFGEPDPTTGTIVATTPRGYGDTLRACVDTSAAPTYEWMAESNGTCGAITTGGANDGDGPDGGTFYFQDEAGDGGNPGSNNGNQGALVQIPGYPEVVTTAYDPVYKDGNGNRWTQNYNAGGIQRHSNLDGTHVGAYNVYDETTSSSLRKQNGLGDIEALCQLPPLEIGNYVWLDLDGDGIQDPSEEGIENVVVALWSDPDGIPGSGDETQVATTTTNPDGEYYFAVNPLQNYYVAIDPNDPELTDYTTTESDYANNDPHPTSGNSTDLHDSDGVLNSTTGTIIIPFVAGNAGQNNYTYDFGFTLAYQADLGDLPDIYGTTITNTAYLTAPIHLITDTLYFGEFVDFERDGLPSLNADGDDTAGTPNDEDGIVFMTPFMAGTTAIISMTAQVSPTVNGTGTAYYGAWIDLDGDGQFSANEHFTGEITDGETILNVPIPASTVVSDTVYSRFRISADLSEVDDLADHVGLAQTGEVEDYALMSLGNRVFLDADGNAIANGATADDGAMGAGEVGIDGVAVELYKAGDTPGVDAPIATTTTANGGEYLFTGLVAGDYVVHLPTSNFGPGQPLEGMTSSSDSATSGNVDPDVDTDDEAPAGGGDENGIDNADPANNGISSQAITLELGAEPTSDGNGPNSNLTVDFGLVYYDLALVKSRSTNQSYAADFSTTPPTASFDITVENQGPTPVYNVAVLETIPTGMSFQSFAGVITGTTGVSDGGAVGANRLFIIDDLAAGETITFQVVLQIDDLSHGIYTNVAEVSNMENSSGTSVPDIDSTPDGIATNDAIDTSPGIDLNGDDDDNSHNDLDFGGTDGSAPGNIVDSATTGDEDDHDQEVIVGGLALGNRVWYDANNSGTLDGGEQGIGNVLVEVYAVDASGNPVGAPVDTATTDANGYWLIDNLPPGDYIAVIPASNFASGMPLADMQSSSDVATSADPENGQESDDNGVQVAAGQVASGVITLDPVAGEPVQSGTEGDLNPTGHGNAGDFFDNLTVDFGFIQYDLGDAPDSYGTTQASDGPRHIQDGTTFLGSSVDPELDGQPSNNADGDDTPTGNDVADDEDGITFLTPIMPGEPFTIQVEASTAGYLNSWIDFDGNGTFDAGEQITSDEPLVPGANTLTFTAPASVDDDSLYSRFRFTANSGEVTEPTGEATSGEVEDYVLMSLGDTVWLDNGAGSTGGADANNGMQDGTEAGIAGVTVELYAQGATPGVDAPIATTTTDANGDYLFTGLAPGDYSVYLPPSNFGDGAPLEDHFSSSDPGGVAVDPDNNQDMDDNGAGDGLSDPINSGILSSPVTLELGTEPDGSWRL